MQADIGGSTREARGIRQKNFIGMARVERKWRPEKKGLLAHPHETKAYSLVYLPVPDRLEVCGAPAALSLARNSPVLRPVWVGLNITLIVQLDWAERVLGQLVPVTLKSPVVESMILASGTFCLLLSVNVFAVLPCPTFVPGKVALVGVSRSEERRVGKECRSR